MRLLNGSELLFNRLIERRLDFDWSSFETEAISKRENSQNLPPFFSEVQPLSHNHLYYKKYPLYYINITYHYNFLFLFWDNGNH